MNSYIHQALPNYIFLSFDKMLLIYDIYLYYMFSLNLFLFVLSTNTNTHTC